MHGKKVHQCPLFFDLWGSGNNVNGVDRFKNNQLVGEDQIYIFVGNIARFLCVNQTIILKLNSLKETKSMFSLTLLYAMHLNMNNPAYPSFFSCIEQVFSCKKWGKF